MFDWSMFIFGAFFLIIISQWSAGEVNRSFMWLFVFLIFSRSIYTFLHKILSYGNTFYAYSDKRIFIRTGFVGTNFKIIDYDKISEMEVTVSLAERLFSVGTVKFYSGKTETDSDDVTKRIYDKWEAIPNPYQVFKKVKTVTVDIKTDYHYPNALRPEINSGYYTLYKK